MKYASSFVKEGQRPSDIIKIRTETERLSNLKNGRKNGLQTLWEGLQPGSLTEHFTNAREWARSVLAARIAVIAATAVVVCCYEAAVVIAAAEKNEKQDNPDTAAIAAVSAEETAIVATAATATVVCESASAATTAE